MDGMHWARQNVKNVTVNIIRGGRGQPKLSKKKKEVPVNSFTFFFVFSMGRKPIYSLTRKLGRMSWNKYNLYNMATKEIPNLNTKTLFQQRWLAKRETRGYHGDDITERQFKNKYFSSKLPTVNAGSERLPHPPVQVLTYAAMERRLDFIVFRSNFCSSIYAARQLCVHGKVKVNGKKVIDLS